MAGSSMTFTYDAGYDGDGHLGRYRRVIADWVSDDATGAVTGTSKKVVGRLVKAVTDPGSPAPSANYDIALTDDASADILANTDATLANRHTSNSETVVFFEKNVAAAALASAPVVCSTITIAITNAGNSKQGQLVLYVEA
jgi:hypothetical protein